MEQPQDSRIAHVIEMMEQRLAERWRVADLASAADLSKSRFAHLFRRVTGVSPARYLHNLRMQRARQLLDRTALPIAQVMLLVGCTDTSHFSKDFRKLFGVAPRDYRRKNADAVHLPD